MFLLANLVSCNKKDTAGSINVTQGETAHVQNTNMTENRDNVGEVQETKSEVSTTKWKQKNIMYDFNFVTDGHYARFLGVDKLYVFGPKGVRDGDYFLLPLIDEWGSYTMCLSVIRAKEYNELMTTKNVKVEKLEDILTDEVISSEMK